MRDGARLQIPLLPGAVADVLRRLSDDAEAVLVGGCVRDLVRGERPEDWDVATSLPPEEVAGRFGNDASWTNPFGTVTVRGDQDAPSIEVTTYRIEGDYHDRRRPERVAWGSSLEEDLGRRDFTINALAWRPVDLANGRGVLVDPYGGAADLENGLLRAVGNPDRRIAEDALRLVRAVRFATRFGLELEPATEAAIRRHAAAAAGLSGERVRDELLRTLAGDQPSRAFLLMERLGLLEVVLPELGALRGVPQAKALPGDALDHSLRTVDALPQSDAYLRLAGLLHDVGKATTLADGHFIGHEVEGERLAAAVLQRLRVPRLAALRIVRLIRQHMFAYQPEWTDAAVRRFVLRVGTDLLGDLFALRAADNAASGAGEPASGGLAELRRRIEPILAADPLQHGDLAVNGRDLMTALEIPSGPMVGTLLARLLEAVLEDPALNHRETLLAMARAWLADGAAAHHESGASGRRAETAAE